MLLLQQDSPLEPWKSNQVTTTCYSIGSKTKQVRLLHMKTEFLNVLCDSPGWLSDQSKSASQLLLHHSILGGHYWFKASYVTSDHPGSKLSFDASLVPMVLPSNGVWTLLMPCNMHRLFRNLMMYIFGSSLWQKCYFGEKFKDSVYNLNAPRGHTHVQLMQLMYNSS